MVYFYLQELLAPFWHRTEIPMLIIETRQVDALAYWFSVAMLQL